mgnify:CR=1 FL=1
MKYFLIEGIVTHPEKMTEDMMKEGKVLFSSLKNDMSTSVTVVRAEDEKVVWEFYKKEPFYQNDVLIYHISELQVHYHNPDIKNWF